MGESALDYAHCARAIFRYRFHSGHSSDPAQRAQCVMAAEVFRFLPDGRRWFKRRLQLLLALCDVE